VGLANGEGGRATLGDYIRAYEMVNGKVPTEEHNRRALALAEVVKKSGLEAFLTFYLTFQPMIDELQRVPDETRKAIDGAVKRFEIAAQKANGLPTKAGPVTTLAPESLAAIEAAVVRAIESPAEEAPAWPLVSRVLSVLRERWPAGAIVSAKWPIALMWAALGLTVILAVGLTSATVQRSRDSADLAVLATPAGVAAVQLAEANPRLAQALRGCQRSVDGGRTVLSGCTFWAPAPNSARIAQKPSWWTALGAVIWGWDPVPLFLAVIVAIGMIAWLAFLKRGPALRRVRPHL
jgi:hypothetical protein